MGKECNHFLYFRGQNGLLDCFNMGGFEERKDSDISLPQFWGILEGSHGFLPWRGPLDSFFPKNSNTSAANLLHTPARIQALQVLGTTIGNRDIGECLHWWVVFLSTKQHVLRQVFSMDRGLLLIYQIVIYMLLVYIGLI